MEHANVLINIIGAFMIISSIIGVIALIIIVAQAYSNDTKQNVRYDQGKKEILDYIAMSISYDLSQCSISLQEEMRYEKEGILVSGNDDFPSVVKNAKEYIRMRRILNHAIQKVFDHYSYKPIQTNLQDNDDLMDYCKKITKK